VYLYNDHCPCFSIEFSPIEEDVQNNDLPSIYQTVTPTTTATQPRGDEFESPLLKRQVERSGLTYEDLRRRNRVGAPPTSMTNNSEKEWNVKNFFCSLNQTAEARILNHTLQ